MKVDKKVILLVSGKRWSGKDYFCDQAIAYFHSSRLFKCTKMSHSAIVKTLYCQQSSINLCRLLADRAYKEAHRNKMIAFAQQLQAGNPTILSEMILAMVAQETLDEVELVFISDFRRKFEQAFFEHAFGKTNVVTIRVTASNAHREKRGWKYDPIKDARYTECELDNKQDWNLIFQNDGTNDDIANWVKSRLANYLLGIFFSKESKRKVVDHDKK